MGKRKERGEREREERRQRRGKRETHTCTYIRTQVCMDAQRGRQRKGKENERWGREG